MFDRTKENDGNFTSKLKSGSVITLRHCQLSFSINPLAIGNESKIFVLWRLRQKYRFLVLLYDLERGKRINHQCCLGRCLIWPQRMDRCSLYGVFTLSPSSFSSAVVAHELMFRLGN